MAYRQLRGTRDGAHAAVPLDYWLEMGEDTVKSIADYNAHAGRAEWCDRVGMRFGDPGPGGECVQ